MKIYHNDASLSIDEISRRAPNGENEGITTVQESINQTRLEFESKVAMAGEVYSYQVVFDKRLKIIAIFGSSQHREQVLKHFMKKILGDSWKNYIRDEASDQPFRMSNSQVFDLISKLKSDGGHVSKLLLTGDERHEILLKHDAETAIPYFALDFSIKGSADEHPFRTMFERNAKTVGFHIRMTGCAGLQEDSKNLRLDVKCSLVFRLYVDRPVSAWTSFTRRYLEDIVRAAESRV